MRHSCALVNVTGIYWRVHCDICRWLGHSVTLREAQDMRDEHEGTERRRIRLDHALQIERMMV